MQDYEENFNQAAKYFMLNYMNVHKEILQMNIYWAEGNYTGAGKIAGQLMQEIFLSTYVILL